MTHHTLIITDNIEMSNALSSVKADAYHATISYVGVSVSSTTVTNYINIDEVTNYINDVSYFSIKDYEQQYGFSSKDMLSKWKVGGLYGPDITDWIMNYMAVKDRIYEPQSNNN